MGLSKKLVKAVKQAQKHAEATVAEVKGVLDSRLSDVNVDPVPFYAVIGAANRAVDTIKHAGEQLEAARKQANSADLREGARKEAAELQKELQKRIADLQVRAAEMQKLAAELAEKVLARAQDLPAQVMNQGLVIASNAKDQYDAAADRGERVVSEMRGHAEEATDEVAAAAEALATPPSEDVAAQSKEATTPRATEPTTATPVTKATPKPPVETVPAPAKKGVPAPTSETIATPTGEVPATVVDEEEDLTQTVAEAVQDEADELKEQLEGAAPALDEAAAAEEADSPVEPVRKKAATKKAPAKKAPAKKAARRPMESGAAKPTPATVAAKKAGPTPAK